MNATLLKFARGLAAVALLAGAVSTANAGYWVPTTCYQQWVQTGPFYGQGYYTTFCY